MTVSRPGFANKLFIFPPFTLIVFLNRKQQKHLFIFQQREKVFIISWSIVKK